MNYGETEFWLVNVPLDIDNAHTYYFSSKEEQFDYFTTTLYGIKHYKDLNYQRKDHKIKIPAPYDEVSKYNYVVYKNNATSSERTYYSFIKEYIYINNECTEIVIETDPIQTYLFDYVVGDSFIEREHVNDDTPGKHTQPENLETGEYVCQAYKDDEMLKEYVYILLVTEYEETLESGSKQWIVADNSIYGGIPQGYSFLVFTDKLALSNEIRKYDSGKVDAIVGAIILPTGILKNWNGGKHLEFSTTPTTYEFFVDKPTKVLNYTPKNKKLLTYPYQSLVVSNNAGTSNILYFEHFSEEKASFKVSGIPVIGGSIKCVPTNYKKREENEEEGIMCGKFPTLSWSADLFTNWCTQNAVNIALDVGSGTLTALVGGALLFTGVGTSVGAGMLAGGVMSVGKEIGQIYEHHFTPNSARGNLNGGDINTSNKTNTFHFLTMSIKEEYAKIIDRYFTMYGYKVSRLGKPLTNHRSRYWYTKIIDPFITGNIPHDELNKIKKAYFNGITFWRKETTFRDYTDDNLIVE